MESVNTEESKFELDKFLELIPDEPKISNYATAARSNSICDQLSHRRPQGIDNIGEVFDSAAKQAKLLRTHSKYANY